MRREVMIGILFGVELLGGMRGVLGEIYEGRFFRSRCRWRFKCLSSAFALYLDS